MPGIDNLTVYRGTPVPWVALWSGEKISNQSYQGAITPEGEQILLANRQRLHADELGIQWMLQRVDRSGVPEFGEVNCHRQASCMKHKRCQVCGDKIDSGPYAFLMDPREFALLVATAGAGRPVTTGTPPVCAPCMEEAYKRCPAMKMGGAVIEARDFRPIGVWGESARPGGFVTKDTPLGDPDLKMTIAKQLIVMLEDYRFVGGRA